jgi:hypothetical protein
MKMWKNLTTNARHKRFHLPKINWGRGRLNKHESIFGFAAKFCRLNYLTPKQFRGFWKTSLVIFDYEQQEKRISRIARVLDESPSIVKTVFSDSYLDRTRLSTELKVFRQQQEQISYCPECLSQGYHGNFHVSDWLRKCPIHQIDLAVNLYLIQQARS